MRWLLVLLMALEFAHGSFQWSSATTAGNTAATIAGLAFQPKALRFWITGQNSAVDATIDSDDFEPGIGFATSTSDRRCVVAFDRDSPTASNAAGMYRDDCVLCLTESDALSDGQLDLSAINSDGFVCIVDVQAVRSMRVFWEAWGGSDITAAATGEISEPAATGNQDYTVTGSFQPGVVLFAASNCTGTPPLGNADNPTGGIGAATGSSNQFTFCWGQDDGIGTSTTRRYGRAGECLSNMFETGTPSTGARAAFVQFNADGFRLNWTEREQTGRRYIYLAIAGGQWTVGTTTIDGSTGSATATVSGLAYQPVGGLLQSHAGDENASDTPATFAVVCQGSFISTSDRMAAGVINEDAVATIEVDHAVEYDQAIVVPNVTSSPPGVLASIDINAVNSDGFQLIVDVAGGAATAVLVGYVTFGSAGGGGTVVKDLILCNGFIPFAR